MNYMEIIEIYKALSNEYRLQILEWLKDPRAYFVNDGHPEVDVAEVGICVGEIQKKLGLTQSTTSQYLTILQKNHFLIATRIGKWTYYRRNESAIQKICEELQHSLTGLAD